MSKILIVDDEPTIVELLEEHLRSEGYETKHAYSGEEALQLLDADVPDLVLLDLMLPGMDGYEVCRLMQKDSRLNHIPVIMLTARSAVQSKTLGYERGADDYVVKPFDPDELSVRVRAQLHHLYRDRVSDLTGLPGSQAVEDRMHTLIENQDEPWALLYIDIENFTVYNEVYSYLEGDELLKLTAQSLQSAVQQAGDKDGFVGHVGGDEFVALTKPEYADKIKDVSGRLFRDGSLDFYSPTDRAHEYMVNVNRQGLLSRVKLCALRFDIVTNVVTNEDQPNQSGG